MGKISGIPDTLPVVLSGHNLLLPFCLWRGCCACRLGGLPEQERESSLRYQTRCLRCYLDATGYAMGSVEGRVAMEYYDMSENVQVSHTCFRMPRVPTEQLTNRWRT